MKGLEPAHEDAQVFRATSRWASGYRYFGRVFGLYRTRVAIHSALLRSEGSHVAVWAGVNASRNQEWVQGGVMQEFGDSHPWAYIEVGPPGAHYSLHTWPVKDREFVPVRLVHSDGRWHVEIVVGGVTHHSREVRVEKPVTVDAMLEVLDHASASVEIGRRFITGGGV